MMVRTVLVVVGMLVGATAQAQTATNGPLETQNASPPAAPEMGGQTFYAPGSGGPDSWISDAGELANRFPQNVPNRYTLTLDSLWLQRNFHSNNNLLGQTVTVPGNTPVQNLFPSGTNTHPGLRAQFQYLLDDELIAEAVYFGIFQWNTNNGIAANPGAGIVAFSPFTQSDKLIGPPGFDQSIGYSYSSRLNNGELNLRAPVADIGSWTRDNLMGFRYMQFNESFHLTGQDAFFNLAETLDTHTSNALVGGQFGTALRRRWIGARAPYGLDAGLTAKGGVFANFVGSQFTNVNSTPLTTGFPRGFVPITRSTTSTNLAGVLDVSAIATYRLNANVAVRGGYQALYLMGVALASQQLAGFSHTGYVFLHGPSAGIEFSR